MVALDLSVLTTCFHSLPSLSYRFIRRRLAQHRLLYYAQSLMLTFSKLGDAKGARSFYNGSLLLYLALLVASLSQSVVQLIVARIIQGGSGSNDYARHRHYGCHLPSEEVERHIGILMGSQSIGLVVGPVLAVLS